MKVKNRTFQSVIDNITSELPQRDVDYEEMNTVLQSLCRKQGHAPVKEARALLSKITSAPLFKDGLYVEDFALVVNAQDINTWKFPLRDEAGTMLPSLLNEAVHGLAQCVEANSTDTTVLEKMKIRILEAGNGTRIPFSRIALHEYSVIREAESEKGKLKVVVIEPGVNSDGDKFYSPQLLAESVSLFEGVHMFMDHATEQEDFERPGGSLDNWVAVLEDVHLGPNGEILGTAIIIDPEFRDKVSMLQEQKKLDMLGVSINAFGEFERGDINGMDLIIVKHFTEIRSADFVTHPGAGGHALVLESQKGGRTYDVSVVSLETLRQKRPDLVAELEAPLLELKEQEKQNMEWEDRFKDLEAKMASMQESHDKALAEKDTQLNEAVAKNNEHEAKVKLAALALSIDKSISESAVPQLYKEKLGLQLKECVSLDEAKRVIKLEEDTCKKLQESGVTGLGRTPEENEKNDDEKQREEGRVALVESVKKREMNRGASEEAALNTAKQYVS